MEQGTFVKEHEKKFLIPGDIVKFKGLDPETSLPMKVKEVVFEKDEFGNYVKNKDGKRNILGVIVMWHNEKGDLIEKQLDTRSVYKVNRSGQYLLHEAKKAFYDEGKLEAVELINQILTKC